MDAKVVNGLNGNDMHAILDTMKTPEKRDGDMTMADMMAYWECSRPTAQKRISKLMAARKIENVWVSLKKGRGGWIYRPVKGE